MTINIIDKVARVTRNIKDNGIGKTFYTTDIVKDKMCGRKRAVAAFLGEEAVVNIMPRVIIGKSFSSLSSEGSGDLQH